MGISNRNHHVSLMHPFKRWDIKGKCSTSSIKFSTEQQRAVTKPQKKHKLPGYCLVILLDKAKLLGDIYLCLLNLMQLLLTKYVWYTTLGTRSLSTGVICRDFHFFPVFCSWVNLESLNFLPVFTLNKIWWLCLEIPCVLKEALWKNFWKIWHNSV